MKKIIMLTLLFSFASCNVVQMLKQTETKVPDAFFGKHHEGPEDQLIFFEAGTNAYYFDTQNETLIDMGSTTTALSSSSFYPYNGDIYFSSTTQGFRYDLSPGVLTPLQSLGTDREHKNFQEYEGHLIWYEEDISIDQLHVIPYNPNGTITPTNLSGPLTNISWIHVDRRHENSENNGEKLFACGAQSVGDNVLYELELTYNQGQLDGYTALLVDVSTDNNPESVFCDQSTAAYGEDGFMIFSDGASIYRYDIDNNAVTNFLSDADILSYENGEVILHDLVEEKISSFNIFVGPLSATFSPNTIYQDQNIMPQVNVLSAPDGRYFFNKKDINNNDQLYEVSGQIPTQLTQFNEPAAPVSIHYFQFGSRGIYIFTNNGIHLLEFDNKFHLRDDPILIDEGFSSGAGFKAISLGEIFHHN